MTNEPECPKLEPTSTPVEEEDNKLTRPKLKPVRVPAEVIDEALSASRENHLGPLRYTVSKFLKVLAKDPAATNEWLMKSLYGGVNASSNLEIDEDLAVANELDTVLENLEKENQLKHP